MPVVIDVVRIMNLVFYVYCCNCTADVRVCLYLTMHLCLELSSLVFGERDGKCSGKTKIILMSDFIGVL